MKKICILGGGHGCARLIKGFKNIDAKIDIIVASSDNGGHTGEILKEFDVPALGDLRMVLENILENNLANYYSFRFDNLNGKNNVSLGNLMLLSLILKNNYDVNKMLEIINNSIDEKYHLYLANNKYLELKAIDRFNNIISGEDTIGRSGNIIDVYFDSEGEVSEDVIKSILSSDVIVMSFGSFYTSLLAVVSNKKIKKAIEESMAKIVYIPNLVNQKETENYVLEDYVDILEKKINKKIDKIIISNNKVKRKIIKLYNKENKKIVVSKEVRDSYQYYPLLSIEDNKLRHNVEMLGQIIIS